MLRCAASFVIAAYYWYASFLRNCAPCLQIYYEATTRNIDYQKNSLFCLLLTQLSRCVICSEYEHILERVSPKYIFVVKYISIYLYVVFNKDMESKGRSCIFS